MNTIFKIALGAGVLFTLASCSTMDPYYGNNRYPNGTYGNQGVYRTPEGTVYRQGDVYRDRNGVVYRNGRVIDRTRIYGRPGIIQRAGNHTARRMPPGQAKKVYGGRATDYAYGQQKKRKPVYYGKQNNKNYKSKGKSNKNYKYKNHRDRD